MNGYDFDKTIFKKDASVGFFLFMFKKRPILMIFQSLKCVWWILIYLLKGIDFVTLKGKVYNFVSKLNNLNDLINEYWTINEPGINIWYLNQKKENDIVISASFDFILLPIIKKLNIKYLIATEYDVKNGKIIGKNCHDKEKIVRFKNLFPKEKMLEAYSDSLSDSPMLDYANKSFIVKGSQLIPYKEYIKNNKKKGVNL